MKKIILLLCFAPLLLASTCNNDDDETIFCTTEAVPAINVLVRLGASTTPTSEGVTVVANSGSFTETLQTQSAIDPLFVGAYERQGTYTVTVSKEGYQTYTSAPFTVSRDECHVITKQLTVALVAN